MEDRANIFVKDQWQEDGGVFLYTHWDGHKLWKTLQQALERRQRWGDDQYLTRIIFSEMIKNDVGGETGYGISSTLRDGSYPLLIVDCRNEVVNTAGKDYSFEEYLTLTQDPRS